MDTLVSSQAAFCAFDISVETTAPRTFTDITDDVEQAVQAAGIESGLALVASRHTTASIVVNEHEPELLKDLDAFLHGLAPTSADYHHNAVPCLPGEGPNAHAHCQALLLNASVTIPVVHGRLSLGRWQRIFLVELDCARSRRVSVSVLGS